MLGFDALLRSLGKGELGASYDALVAGLRLLGREPLKTLLFTSTQPAEGKTTVVVGLALALARARARVLLVDLDLRRPAVHRMLPVENREGLGALLAGDAPPRDLIQRVKIPASRAGSDAELGVVTAGAGVDHTLLQATTAADLSRALEALAVDFDRVLIDSPPILSVADPLLLAPGVDGVVLVVQAGAVAERDARRARQRLERAGGRLVGVVMNRFDEKLYGPGLDPYHAYYTENA